MDERQRDIIVIRVAKCREDLTTAREDWARERYRAAVARAYYAIFHLTGAALLTIGVERAKHFVHDTGSFVSSPITEIYCAIARFHARTFLD